MRLKWLRPSAQACAIVRGMIVRGTIVRGTTVRGMRSGAMPAPVPGFVHDAVRIIARVAHHEAVRARVVLQPGEGTRLLETLFRRRLIGRADVERTAAMVFAEA